MTDKRARRRAILWGCAAGGFLFVVGAPLSHAVLVALAIFAAIPVLHAASIQLHERPEVPRHLRRQGFRQELAKLTRYRVRQSRGTDEEAIRRLRAVAHRRLSDLGMDPDDPAQTSQVQRVLGPLAYRVLIVGTAPSPTPHRHFSRCVDVVEALARYRRDHEVGISADVRGTS